MAKLNSYITVALSVGFAFMLCNCTKTKHKNYIELDTDSAVMAHFNFKPGSYWIYKDAFSGRTDSFYVRNNYHTTQTEAYNVYDYHFITIAQLNMDNTNPGDSANWVFNYQGIQIMLDYNYTANAYGWKYDIQYRPLYRYPFLYGDQKSLFDTASIIQVDSTFVINGLTFSNVARVYHLSNADSTEGPNITKYQDLFYINDSVGMVEMTINHPYNNINRDWQLMRYNIVK